MKTNSITSTDILERLTEFLTKPGEFWQKQPFEIKKKLQWFVFPKGVIFCDGKFRTGEISNVYMVKELFSEKKFSLVGVQGIEPCPCVPKTHILPIYYTPISVCNSHHYTIERLNLL